MLVNKLVRALPSVCLRVTATTHSLSNLHTAIYTHWAAGKEHRVVIFRLLCLRSGHKACDAEFTTVNAPRQLISGQQNTKPSYYYWKGQIVLSHSFTRGSTRFAPNPGALL